VSQSLPARVPGFAGERPSTPVSKSPNPIGAPLTFQECQKSPMSSFVFSTLSMYPFGLAEAPAKGPDLQIVPGKLLLAGNLESLDDALCSVLMRSHVGEDEDRLEAQPLNVLYPCIDNELEFLGWVIKCAKQVHSRVGISYIGQKWQFMALLTFIEKERLKELEAQSPSASKRNREIKNLESSINYDNRGEWQSSHGKHKGRGNKVVL
jgi:hypothetical protein